MGYVRDVVLDGPPGAVSGRFVEVEDEDGAGINFGRWVEREDGTWALRILVCGDCAHVDYDAWERALPLHRTEAGTIRCSTCDGGGCPDCTDSAD